MRGAGRFSVYDVISFACRIIAGRHFLVWPLLRQLIISNKIKNGYRLQSHCISIPNSWSKDLLYRYAGCIPMMNSYAKINLSSLDIENGFVCPIVQELLLPFRHIMRKSA